MARSSNGQIIRAGRGAETLGNWLNQNMDQLAHAMPRGTRPERLARVFVTEVQRVPGLLRCTPVSLIAGFCQATQCGLEIGSHLGQAYLVPFKNKGRYEATLIVGYKGLVAMAYRSGLVQNVQAFDVREVDDYEEPALGTEPRIVHRPKRGREDSELVAAYAVVRLHGAPVPNIEWMWVDEIEKVKGRSRAAASRTSPWHTDYSMMARKTALRRACKYIPQTTESRIMHTAIAVDEAADANIQQPYDIAPDLAATFPVDLDPPEDEPESEDDGTLSAEEEERMERDLAARGD